MSTLLAVVVATGIAYIPTAYPRDLTKTRWGAICYDTRGRIVYREARSVGRYLVAILIPSSRKPSTPGDLGDELGTAAFFHFIGPPTFDGEWSNNLRARLVLDPYERASRSVRGPAVCIVEATGWPLPVIIRRVDTVGTYAEDRSVLSAIPGVRLDWRGCAIDGFFWTFLIFLVLSIGSMARRHFRWRRGVGGHCGYPVDASCHSGVCSECGGQLPRVLAT